MSKRKGQRATSTTINASIAEKLELLLALEHSAKKFQAEIAKNDRVSVYVAQHILEEAVHSGELSASELVNVLEDDGKFNQTILAAEIYV